MVDHTEASFLREFSDDLRAFWNRVGYRVPYWRDQYQWPKGASLEGSVNTRTQLESLIQTELEMQGCLSKSTFDAIIRWGFGNSSGCSDQEVRQATRLAFRHLKDGHLAEAARALVKLPRVGISRASKVLALSDQLELGIYDSRSAHGLSDLVDRAGRRIITIPPGRVIPGDPRTKDEFCRGFEKYIYSLRYLRNLALEDSSLSAVSWRVADIEMAFFMRSRSGELSSETRNRRVPEHLRTLAEHNEDDAFWTLGPGRKSRQFFAIVNASAVTIFTGEKSTTLTLNAEDIDACLSNFGVNPFPLSNSKTAAERNPKGLGEYFARNFGSSVFASHFAALWAHQGLLEAKRDKGAWWLRVLRDRAD